MKRKTTSDPASGRRAAKKPKPDIPEYHETPQVLDAAGNPIWPAAADKMEEARSFILECARAHKPTLLVPDKDADGLSAGVILHRTLILLGLPPALISVYLLAKGANIHQASSRTAMALHSPSYIFILDQGSRASPSVIDAPHKALVIDHHHATPADFPAGAQHITACACPPVATTALLTFLLCRDLHPEVAEKTDWLAALGTHGDLGNVKWLPPFPDLQPTLRRVTKSAIDKAVALVNAPRRTAGYTVSDAWDTLLQASGPKELLTDQKLNAAREEVAAEVERCAHAPPKFSANGRIAVLRIRSAAQVHPVIATRWAGFLSSAKLEVVMVANEGYLPEEGLVNFSCRVARCARGRGDTVDIIRVLEDVAGRAEDKTLRERLGGNFAKGHREASGGIVGREEFEELMRAMGVGEKPDREGKERKGKDVGQRNKIENYFQAKAGP